VPLGPFAKVAEMSAQPPIVAQGRDGTPFIAAEGAKVLLHRGLDPATTDQVVEDVCCANALNLGVDAQGGKVWLVWKKVGADQSLYLHAANPSTGAPVGGTLKVPGANGRPAKAYVDQRLAVSGRTGRPGVFVAYASSNRHSLLLWRVGSKRAVVAATSKGTIERPALAPGPGGRLWLAWIDNTKTRAAKVRQLRPNGSSFGRIGTYALPRTGSFVSPTALEASARGTRVDLVLVISGNRSGRVFLRSATG
jgi:hypothetical protein